MKGNETKLHPEHLLIECIVLGIGLDSFRSGKLSMYYQLYGMLPCEDVF